MTIENKYIIDKKSLTEKTENLLEYPLILEKIASLALSEEASSILKNSHPVYEDSVLETKEIINAIYKLLKNRNDEPRLWLPSIGFLLPKIETQGIVLDIDETLAIGLFIERANELRKWVIKDQDQRINANEEEIDQRIARTRTCDTGSNKEEIGRGDDSRSFVSFVDKFLDSLCNNFPDCGSVSNEIFRIIDKEGKMRDLPVLRAIKRRINSLEKELKNTVLRYSADDDYKRMLQSPLPSLRDGRAVLAVKVNFRGRIRGIVHEVSSSGQTIFVEPLDVVEKNNELLIEKRNLDAEIQKILRELTEKIAIHNEDLKNLHTRIIHLECLRAKAKYSVETKGHFAINSENLILLQARHPLLKKPVPINISMNDKIRTLIITGPNTGGKTVALKTLGLFAMMNQSGLALPVEEGSILPIFDGIYADIGDEQSINQSLSTFSAHITKISAITAAATEKSLVLLDELGSGTDPHEGGAIAMAVLDYLIEKKNRMIITTHHGILKHYGYTRHGVENASVEFDAQTLSPTYKIINGLPGESRALDIASANGLNPKIVSDAGKYIEDDKTDVSEMIKNLEQKQRELSSLEKKSKIEQNMLREEKRKTDLRELQLRQREAELKRESAGKLQQFLRESRKTLENLVRELKEGEVDREKTLKVKEFLNELTRNAENESACLVEEERILKEQILRSQGKDPLSEQTGFSFSPGMEVLAGSSKQHGTIIRADKKDGSLWLVKIGSLKISFPQSELIPINSEKNPVKPAAFTSWAAEYGSSDGAVFELKLLGKRLEEAKEALRRQIEAAVLSGLKNFSVVHGTGSGILQKGIHEYLKNDPAVADYYFARPELGGFGRTEVVLK
jgi:DNA mismatch repair protein MutS2